MPLAIDDIAADFSAVDDDLRLAMLLDHAKKLPPAPADLLAAPDLDARRVRECMTPVHLWVLPDADRPGAVRVHVAVAEEAPTVKGVLSIVARACDRRTPEEIASFPTDLVGRLGLGSCLRMNRVVGLSAIIARIKREAAIAGGRS
jgi:cysteine desulfuration protein SufE